MFLKILSENSDKILEDYLFFIFNYCTMYTKYVIEYFKKNMEVSMSNDKMYLKAYGKINLALDVIRRREDGYHDVRMVMQTVGIYDGIEIVKTNTGRIEIETNIFYLPTNENNIVYKAVKLLFDEFNITAGVRIKLKKFIPVAAGMAGGSADAASVLFGINKMFNLKLSLQELMERGVKIGADVPYCLMRGTALSEGIGEKLTRLPDMVQCPVLIAKPPISVSTKYVYENLKLDENTKHPDIYGMIEAIENQNLKMIASKMGNVLESVTIKEYPEIEVIKKTMLECNALNSLMSGSGPTVFGLFETKEDAYKAKEKVKELNYAKQVYVTDMYLPIKREGK